MNKKVGYSRKTRNRKTGLDQTDSCLLNFVHGLIVWTQIQKLKNREIWIRLGLDFHFKHVD